MVIYNASPAWLQCCFVLWVCRRDGERCFGPKDTWCKCVPWRHHKYAIFVHASKNTSRTLVKVIVSSLFLLTHHFIRLASLRLGDGLCKWSQLTPIRMITVCYGYKTRYTQHLCDHVEYDYDSFYFILFFLFLVVIERHTMKVNRSRHWTLKYRMFITRYSNIIYVTMRLLWKNIHYSIFFF